MAVFAASLCAQITVTDATFPAAGDTLKYATDLNPDGVTITPAGGPTDWDFTALAPTAKSETIFSAAADGNAFADFPEAELVVFSANGQGETYYDVNATSFNNLGFFGADPTGGLPIQTAFKFSPPVPERNAPLHFIDDFHPETTLNLTLPIDSALSAILGQLGLPAGLADSIRIGITASRDELVDAYGTLSIPGGSYDVLRKKSTEYRDTHLEIHTFGFWLDVTGQAGAAAGLGKDTTITYSFISNTEKEFIAVVTMDNTGTTVQQVEYKDNGVVSGNSEVATTALQVLVSPNPASNKAVFTLKNLAPGNYSLRLMNARGQVALRSKLSGTDTSVPLDGLGSGTYFYQVFDENSRAAASGKLLIVNQ